MSIKSEMTNGNKYCDSNLLQLFLYLIEGIDEYHYYRKSEKRGSSNLKRDEELMENWEKIKNIRTFPKGFHTRIDTGEELDSMVFVDRNTGEMSKIVKIQQDLYWDGFPNEIELDWSILDDHNEKWGVGKDTYWVLDINLGKKWEKTTKNEYEERFMNPKVGKGSSNPSIGVMV